jgi:hypothetical protein
VLPVLEDVLGPGVALALARTADQLREDADALDALAAELLAAARAAAEGATTPAAAQGAAGPDAVPGADPRTGPLDVAALADAPAALRRRALRAAAIDAGCPPGSVHRTHVLALDALVTAWHGQGPVDLPGRVRFVRTYGRLTSQPPQD